MLANLTTIHVIVKSSTLRWVFKSQNTENTAENIIQLESVAYFSLRECTVIVHGTEQARRHDLAAGGAKNQEGPKPEVGGTF